jgi:transcriptional regulator
MLVHPWDAATGDDEWREWLGTRAPFGQLIVNNVEPAHAPLAIPTHAVLEGEELLIHLARPNPVWPHIEAAAEVRFSVIGDYAYIPSTWRSKAGGPDEDGVPTSYYAAVQFVCRPTLVDNAKEKAALLRAQFARIQPEGGHAPVETDDPPYGRMLPGIRGLRLQILEVLAKFKYDDHNPIDHRVRVSAALDERDEQHDAGAAAQQRRRLELRGEWRER